jgi:hypothetical protein
VKGYGELVFRTKNLAAELSACGRYEEAVNFHKCGVMAEEEVARGRFLKLVGGYGKKTRKMLPVEVE